MKPTSLIGIFAICSGATATILARLECKADNCLRAVRASTATARGTADCLNYLVSSTTLAGAPTAPTPTVTITLYSIYGSSLVNPTPTPAPTPGTIPAYASPCSGSVRYSSACSCIGITSSLVVVSTVTPPAATQTSIITACRPANDYGHVFASGSYTPPPGTTDVFTSFPGTSASCCAACFRTPGCMIYQHFWGTCYLKSYTGGSVVNAGNAVCKAGIGSYDLIPGNALGVGPCLAA